MDYYLEELKRALEEYNVSNKEEILDKYRKRYLFGIESGLTNYEIEQMLGKPVDVASRFGNKKFNYDEENDLKNDDNYNDKFKNFIISTSIDDIKIIRDDVSGIKSKFIDCSPDNYEIEENDSLVSLTIKKKRFSFFSSKIGGRIIITIPRKMCFNNVKITSVTSDISLDDIFCNSFELTTVSGDVEFNNVESHDVRFQTVSGDVKGKFVDCNKTIFQTVSGDIAIDAIKGYNLNCETISGDFKVNKTNCIVKASKVAGNIKIEKGEF